ncbi:MAG TPA: MauE/DoxX family redox-associated membrane protein [Bryobacteraceae bacterium]|nr:MauE/DoxX family redox-associated membrane protein [Bryobacteraceae bacterium]
MRRLVLVLRLILGLVFLYAAYTKLREPWMVFAMSIDAYQLLPQWAVLLLGHWLPWFELLLGVFLAAGILLRYTAATATGLLMVFFTLMTRAYLKGMAIDCGCFGSGEVISVKTLARDGLLLVLSIALTLLAVSTSRTSPRTRVVA